ncbi:hypothetical protein [Planomonospora parontospora]|jgi:hypothetical protein|nr:hypothetical protein [Planomonospora parontospora]GGL50489.1 hypothetical protein GCM10014719_59730 [Planomonospora parontospora subsp. antibiotica]GII18991.1 hypothetical protein Ppa05_57170 [Planomonospora parontospora subsp. antibiotica]
MSTATITVEDLLAEIDDQSAETAQPISTVVMPDIKAQAQYPKMV